MRKKDKTTKKVWYWATCIKGGKRGLNPAAKLGDKGSLTNRGGLSGEIVWVVTGICGKMGWGDFLVTCPSTEKRTKEEMLGHAGTEKGVGRALEGRSSKKPSETLFL